MCEVKLLKYKSVWNFVLIAVIVFVAIFASFTIYGIIDAKSDDGEGAKSMEDFVHKNIFVSVQNSETLTLDTNVLVNFDPKDMSISTIYIPSDTCVEIASSSQMIRDVMNIGGIDMLHSVLPQIFPVPTDYHLIIKSEDLFSEKGDYKGLLRYIFSSYIWEHEDIKEYLDHLLSLSSTDLTLVRTEEYAKFLNKFSKHTNYEYVLPGSYKNIADKTLYVVNPFEVNSFVNEKILSK